MGVLLVANLVLQLQWLLWLLGGIYVWRRLERRSDQQPLDVGGDR